MGLTSLVITAPESSAAIEMVPPVCSAKIFLKHVKLLGICDIIYFIIKRKETVDMEIKADLFDIDGTLVNDSRAVLKINRKTIQSLKEEGIYVGLATGRGPAFVKPFMERYGLILQ